MASSWKSLCRGTRSEKMPRERSTSRSRPRFSANQHRISVPLSAPAGKLAALEGVEHQVHLPTDALADGVHDGDLALERRRLPAVNFVGGIAHFQALLREVNVYFWIAQAPWLMVAQVGTVVAGTLLGHRDDGSAAHRGTRCGHTAHRALCGGRWGTGGPTATASPFQIMSRRRLVESGEFII